MYLGSYKLLHWDVVQAGLKIGILLSQPPKFWNQRIFNVSETKYISRLLEP